MDSRLLIGSGIPTPDPTARAPWYVTSIGPHRLLELPPVTTAVSLTLSACLFSFCLVLGGTPGGWGGIGTALWYQRWLCVPPQSLERSGSMWNIWLWGDAPQ